MREQWYQCIDFPAYEVSSLGNVRRLEYVRGKPPVILRPWLGGGGNLYLKVSLSRDGRQHKVYVHRLIARAFHSLGHDQLVDHRTHNTKDHSQIRIATAKQNAQNSRGWADHSSRYKGVSWDRGRKKWFACIAVDGRTKYLGRYKTEKAAALAYDRAAFDAWGDFAFLNFNQGD